MTETKAPDYAGMARGEIQDLNEKRGLVAAELEEIEAELAGHRGPAFDSGALALDAVLGDEEAREKLEARDRREKYLEERAALCEAAIAHADERMDAMRRTWLTGAQTRDMPLEEIPEVLRERVREQRADNGRGAG